MQTIRAPAASARVAGRRVALRAPRVSRKTVVVQAVKKSVGDLTKADLEGKRVFVRADLNVPLDKEQKITDDTRIRAAVPTLKYLLDNGAKVLLTSHLVSPRDAAIGNKPQMGHGASPPGRSLARLGSPTPCDLSCQGLTPLCPALCSCFHRAARSRAPRTSSA